MNRHNDKVASQGLERNLSRSIERMRDNIVKNNRLRREITKLRRQRRQLEAVPDDVREWFEEVEAMEEEEEE